MSSPTPFTDAVDELIRDCYMRATELATDLLLHFGDMAPAWLNLFRLLALRPARA